jgi:type II secretory pathway pseudopilin PulG
LTNPNRRPSAAGFSVLELIVSLFVLAIVLVAMLGLFDATNRVARAQANVSDTQQAVRIGHDEMVRMTRMAGRGWMYWRLAGAPWAPNGKLNVVNNAGTSTFVNGSTTPALQVRPGTDVLRLSGVMNGSLFEITRPNGVFLTAALTIHETSPTGIEQDLDQLRQVAEDNGNTPFSVVAINQLGAINVYDALVTGEIPEAAPLPAGLTLTLQGVTVTSPIVVVGVLEEFAFYVRENGGEPRLSMARFMPGTNNPYGGVAANLQQDLADDIIDLQVALAIDTYVGTTLAGDKTIAPGEWYYDSAADPGPPPAFGVGGDLHYVRINTLGRTAGQDYQYISPPIARIEDHVFGESATPATPPERLERQHRRRLLTTLIDTRNM